MGVRQGQIRRILPEGVRFADFELRSRLVKVVELACVFVEHKTAVDKILSRVTPSTELLAAHDLGVHGAHLMPVEPLYNSAPIQFSS